MKNSKLLARIFSFLLALGGLLYLELNRSFFIQENVFLLSDIANYLPKQKKILGFGLVLFIYICFWYSESKPAKIYRAAFWANLLALFVSYTVEVISAGISLSQILPYLNGQRIGKPVFLGWISYIATWLITYPFLSGFYGINLRDRKELLIRGKKLISLDTARKISNQKLKNDNPGVQFGWLAVPESQATTHFAVVGSTGSGKTLLIRFLLQSVLPRIGEEQDSRALIYDAKRDMLPILSGMKLSSKIVTLHPFDERSAAWDMAKDIRSPAAADQMSSILIPTDNNSTNPFFADAARALMTGVITVFIKRCPDDWTFRDVIVALKSAARLKQVLLECEETKDLVEQYFSNEKTANDVMSTLATKIQRYQYIAAAWNKAKTKVSLKDWINEEFILVLGNDEETRSAVDAINQVIFKRVTELILNQSESFTRRTWVILDELKEAGLLPGLPSLLSKGRSKGACTVIGFQDIEGLSASMKDSRVANEIVGLCANKAILRLDSAETAKWASVQFGEQELEERKISTSEGTKDTSKSESWINHKREAVMPVEFLDLPPVNKSDVLHGYYIVPSIGSYYAGIKMSGNESVLSSLAPLDSETPSYIERDKENQYLRLWEEQDLKRLNILKEQSDLDIKSHIEHIHKNPLELINRE